MVHQNREQEVQMYTELNRAVMRCMLVILNLLNIVTLMQFFMVW